MKVYPILYAEDLMTIAEIVIDLDSTPKKKFNRMRSKHRKELCEACIRGMCKSRKSKNNSR